MSVFLRIQIMCGLATALERHVSMHKNTPHKHFIILSSACLSLNSILPCVLGWRYQGVSFGLSNAWVWMQSSATIRNKVQLLVERIVGMPYISYTCCMHANLYSSLPTYNMKVPNVFISRYTEERLFLDNSITKQEGAWHCVCRLRTQCAHNLVLSSICDQTCD